ncbi:MAG: xanthine phosphoribosyltransferase [Clostridiales bacterium]|jgi:xanthine phosphoribosyltransferase|nr:xanthine phosphoribosyltransferase [Clostridiales bacterium]
MQLLKDRILKDGKALNKEVLKVDMFLNQQVDTELTWEIGREFARLFADAGITRVVTIEASGIAPAYAAALQMKLPLVILKKAVSIAMDDSLIQTEVFSFTKQKSYQLTLQKEYIRPDDKVLIIDDFLAMGEAAFGAISLVEKCGATVGGIGAVICKSHQPGLKKLKEAGYKVHALAKIAEMDKGYIRFEED